MIKKNVLNLILLSITFLHLLYICMIDVPRERERDWFSQRERGEFYPKYQIRCVISTFSPPKLVRILDSRKKSRSPSTVIHQDFACIIWTTFLCQRLANKNKSVEREKSSSIQLQRTDWREWSNTDNCDESLDHKHPSSYLDINA